MEQLDPRELNFVHNLQRLRVHNYTGYIAVICTILSFDEIDENNCPDAIALLKETSKGQFKRAIKCLREFQAKYPKNMETYTSAVSYIRRRWLGKDVIA